MEQALIEVILLSGLLIFSSFLGVYTINMINNDEHYVASMNNLYARNMIVTQILDLYRTLSNSTMNATEGEICISQEIVFSRPLALALEEGKIIIGGHNTRSYNITTTSIGKVLRDLGSLGNNSDVTFQLKGVNNNVIISRDIILEVCMNKKSSEISVIFYKPG